MTDGIYFYSPKHKYGEFSNFYRSPIKDYLFDKVIIFPTTENYFQAYKAIDDPKLFMKIATVSDPGLCFRLGRKAKIGKDWDYIKYAVMLRALHLKFTQHPRLKKLLISTFPRKIYEDAPKDFIWGYRKNGLNLLGKALEYTRYQIMNEENLKLLNNK